MYKYEFKLKQVTPMIHFQHYESGATLRSTEVKPKLDKFLWYCIQEKNYLEDIKELVDALENEYEKSNTHRESILLRHGEDKLPENLKKEKHEQSEISQENVDGKEVSSKKAKKAKKKKEELAFRYRLRIETSDSAAISEDINAMYFGNMGEDTKKKKSVFVKQPLNCSIITDSPILLSLIKKVLPAFFLLHNFGTRQTKGFGGFEVVGNFRSLDEIKKYNKYDFLCIEKNSVLDFSSAEVKMNIAKWIYALMKGGINFNRIYEKGFLPIYFLKHDIGNEKAFMKQKILNISAVKQEGNEDKIVLTPPSAKLKCEYVRALLGITENYLFKSGEGGQRIGEPNVSVWSSKKQLGGVVERYASPILIKITKDILYFIPTDDGKAIAGKKFYFSSSVVDPDADNKPGFPNLLVPDLPNLSWLNGKVFIEDFLGEFYKHFNEVQKKAIYNKQERNANRNKNNTKDNHQMRNTVSFPDVCKSQMHYVKVIKEETSK